MDGKIHAKQRSIIARTIAAALAYSSSALIPWTQAAAVPLAHPLYFFEGRTESIGTMKAIMNKTHRVRSIGRGTIGGDGSLTLVQQVRDEGQPPSERIWRIRQITPKTFTGTMSEATGPIRIDQIGEGYRFRFTLRGGFSAEQWLIPSSDGNSGASILTVRKFGMTVARSDAIIRRLSQQASNSR